MWAEFLDAIGEGRRGSADFSDGVRDSAVIDALYAAAASGTTTRVALPGAALSGTRWRNHDDPRSGSRRDAGPARSRVRLADHHDRVREAVRPRQRRVAGRRPGRGSRRDARIRCS